MTLSYFFQNFPIETEITGTVLNLTQKFQSHLFLFLLLLKFPEIIFRLPTNWKYITYGF